MIEFMSSWVKGLGLAIVIVSILEMLLPTNKTKKYIRMVMGLYVLFTIISPFINSKDVFNINNIDLEKYTTTQANIEVNQTSMNERIKELYIEELEKDIKQKLNDNGYDVLDCKVKAQISNKEEETKITKIKLKVQKALQKETDNGNEIEEKIVTQIQKIKPIDTTINNNSLQQQVDTKENTNTKISKSDIQNIKKFLIEEYEVNEKCLEIN